MAEARVQQPAPAPQPAPTPQPAPAAQSAPAEAGGKAVSTQQQSSKADPEVDLASVRSSRPKATAPVTATIAGADGASALPKGFFDDKKSDAIAQGEKPRTAADAAKDLQAFQREVDQLEEKQIAVAAEEAEEAAERAAAQEELEDKCEPVLLCILLHPIVADLSYTPFQVLC